MAKKPGLILPLDKKLDLNIAPESDRRRLTSGLRPDDPSRYRAKIVSDQERQMMELWAFNFWTATGRKFQIPATLYEVIKSDGVDVQHMEPMAPNLY